MHHSDENPREDAAGGEFFRQQGKGYEPDCGGDLGDALASEG